MAHIVFVETTHLGIQAIEAAKRFGHRVSFITSGNVDWLLTEEDKMIVSQNVDHVWNTSDTQDVDAVRHALKACSTAFPVDAVLSTLHQCVPATTAAAAELGFPSTSPTGIENARDKSRCRQLLDEAQIPSVKHASVHSAKQALAALETIGYPAIIKPTTGMGKLITTFVHSESDVLAHFEQAESQLLNLDLSLRRELSLEFIIEELAVGPLYSIEVGVSAHGEWMPFAILRRKTGAHNPILEMGSIIPCGLSEAQYDEVAQYAIRVLKVLGLDLGIFHVEFIYTQNGPRLVEVNPRIAGGTIPDLIRAATGANLFEYLVRIFLGERIGLTKLECKIAASHSLIGVAEHCTVRANLPENWFEPIQQRLHSGYVDIRPGQIVKKMHTNYDVYGVVRTTADSYDAVVSKIDGFYAEVEQVLGIKLTEIRN
ncbi:biotin carboxylase [Undibacterium sp. GrIS 1.2]|uniref:ATP-grasp domain-containing protein n=1 Tax=Undibacterium sp. GrIS 1.2 TaxID=3143933 RepID=UPI0033922AFB